MGERGATGGAWGARDDASWWSGGSGELQHQQQINEEIARSTAAATHQLYTYKMTGGFSNNGGDNSTPNFDYRMITNSSTREESTQQPWWYASASVENQQASSPSSQNQGSSDSEQNNQQANGIQQNHQVLQQQVQKEQNQIQQQQNQLQQQLQQHQNLQQALQQQAQNLQQSMQQNQQQTLQQMLQQQQQIQQHQQQSQQQQTQSQIKLESQSNQPNLIQVTQAQAQALVAQAALQQQVAQTLQHQQQSLQEHLQAVQQQQIQAALQRQSATLQELQHQAQQQAIIAQNTVKTRMPRAKPFNKPRGRMTAYAFFVQTCREEHKKKYPDENVVFAAFSKKCAERWNTMSEKEKMRFHEMAEQDKKRYDLEMKNYVPPKDIKVRRKRQQIKDPNAPKRSLSAFFWFCNDERSKVKAKNPEYTMGDIAKALGRRWAAADPDTKSKYEALSEQDKARYDREMTAYKKGPLVLQQQQVQQLDADDDAVEYEGDEEYK